ncbi:hypothetical protein N7501_010760 [Penicillium viridicatum]|nr:hypothetical protein N7501_010760 [Penicillium viridicatum]
MVCHLRGILKILALRGWPPPKQIAGASSKEPSCDDHKAPKALRGHQLLAYGPLGPGGRGRWVEAGSALTTMLMIFVMLLAMAAMAAIM